jgi:ElaB/YqjD/DUF883 family membrane-anchored ribosome-binding protein
MEQSGKPVAANGMSGTVARVLDDAGTGAHGAIDKMSAAAVPAVDRLASGAHQAVTQATTSVGGVASSMAAKADQLLDAQSRVTEECRGYVREYPLASVGIAVAAGFILSRLLSAR